MRNLLTEFIGTFLFVFTVALAVQTAGPMAPLAIGLALMVVVYMGGHISGAHYNPAVTLALTLRGGLTFKAALAYIAAQITGAFAAAAVAYVVTGYTFTPHPGATTANTTALLVEVIFTFMLCLVVLNVAAHPRTKGNPYYGAAIGLTVAAAAYAGGPISGGAYNPAVATGPILFDLIRGGKAISNLWIYWAGPLTGAVMAFAVFRMQMAGETEG